MLFERLNLVEIEYWADVCLSTLFQRWQNNLKTTMKELRQFNFDDRMLFQHWYLVENESWINVCSSALPSTLRKQHWNNCVNCYTGDLYSCSLESGLKTKQNYVSKNKTYISFKILEHNQIIVSSIIKLLKIQINFV